MRLKGITLAAFVSVSLLGQAVAQSCDLDSRRIDQYAASQIRGQLDGFIATQVDKLQAPLLRKIADGLLDKASGTQSSVGAFGLTVASDLTRAADSVVSLRKTFVALEAFAAGDDEALRKMAYDEASSKAIEVVAAQILGSTTLVGPMNATVKYTKESFEALEHEDCLLNIDLAYYRFLDNAELQYGPEDDTAKINAINYYLDEFIRGGGNDPNGASKRENRRQLQCYIDQTMRPDQRVDISSDSTLQKKTNTFNPFAIIADVMASSENRALRVPTLLMLDDFHQRREIEKMRQNSRLMVQSAEYPKLRQMIGLLGSYPVLADWLCEKLDTPAPETSNVACRWVSAGVGDIAYHRHKVGRSNGSQPLPRYCQPNMEISAVCWSAGENGSGGPWCTYKDLPASRVSGGAHPGNLYRCDC